MSILCITNRTENWKTARYFSPLFTDESLRQKFAERLSKPYGISPSQVSLELFWKGIRDYLHNADGEKEEHFSRFAESYSCLFPDLRERIKGFSQFRSLNDCNYDPSTREREISLGNNLANTEIDIVLESPECLFIGEAKGEMSFNTDGKRVLVHQLIRQYVMASLLIHRLGADRKVIPFVIGDRVERLKRTRQVGFMIEQGWLKDENVLSWNHLGKLTGKI